MNLYVDYVNSIKSNSKCICGSRKKFAKCCRAILRDKDRKTNINHNPRLKKSHSNLVLARADLAKYLVFHRIHTIPFLQTNSEESRMLADIDLEATSDILDTLRNALVEEGRGFEFKQVLNELEDAIKHPLWSERLTAQLTLYRLGREWDEDAGRTVLDSISDPELLKDVDLISLYISLYGDKISPRLKSSLAKTIALTTKDATLKLQYSMVQAVIDLESGHSAEALKLIETAIVESESKITSDEDIYGKNMLARALDLKGKLSGDKDCALQAHAILKSLLDSGNITPHGLSNIYSEMGECSKQLEQFERAIDEYKNSLEQQESMLVRVFLSQAYLYTQNIQVGLHNLQQVEYLELDNSGKFDYCYTLTGYVIKLEDPHLKQDCVDKLTSLEIPTIYFRDARRKCIELLNDLPTGGSPDRRWSSFLQMVSKYLNLKPGLFGIGINGNSILDDISGKSN